MGYSEDVHGRDAWKLVPGLRVHSISLYDKATGSKVRELEI